MKQVRAVERVLTAYPTAEGAGVKLHRAFGYYELPQFDPFLMLDDFRSNRPADYLAGFPLHPHRGIETVTYLLAGSIDHEDSTGHIDSIGAGDVEWMTAGSGIIHQEMPKPVRGRMGGFQLWINLPRAAKMIPPKYRSVKHFEIPVVEPRKNISIRVIAGTVNEVTGPVLDIIADPEYIDLSLGPDTFFTHPVRPGYSAFAYVIAGGGTFDSGEGHQVANRDCILFGDGSSIWVRSGGTGMRFLFCAAKPIGEPVAWRGSIVMNTREELRTAFREYADGTFIKERA